MAILIPILKFFKVDDYSFDNLYKEANLNIKNYVNFKYNEYRFFKIKLLKKLFLQF